MAIDLSKLRNLLSLDPADPLSRFALGKRLFETADDSRQLAEAVEHLSFTNAADPTHLATYHLLGQALMKQGDFDRARQVLSVGIERVAGVGHGMGRDLGPAMTALLQQAKPV